MGLLAQSLFTLMIGCRPVEMVASFVSSLAA